MNVIFYPVVTEKTVEDMKKGKYSFVVSKQADKPQIKKEVQDKFGVDVVDIATINVKERKRKTMQGKIVREHSLKKAIVKIKEGQKINVFETGGKKS